MDKAHYANAVLMAAATLDEAIDGATCHGLRVTLTLRQQIRIPGPSSPGVSVTIDDVTCLGRYRTQS